MRHAIVIAVFAAVLLAPWAGDAHACVIPGAGETGGPHGMTAASGDPHGMHAYAVPNVPVGDTPPCHTATDEAPMPCCDGDDDPAGCASCDCAAAGVQSGALPSVALLRTHDVESRTAMPAGTDPPEPPPGALLRPPIVLT